MSSICDAGAPNGSVRLQCYPRDLEDWLGVSAATGCTAKDPAGVISVKIVMALVCL